MAYRVICLDSGPNETPTIERSSGATGIIPGMLLKTNSANKFVVHDSAAGAHESIFALEDLTVGGDIDTAYPSGSVLRAAIVQPGYRVNGLVAAAAAAIVIGDKLESAGDGTVRKTNADTAIVGFATSAVDNSLGASTARIQFRVA